MMSPFFREALVNLPFDHVLVLPLKPEGVPTGQVINYIANLAREIDRPLVCLLEPDCILVTDRANAASVPRAARPS